MKRRPLCLLGALLLLLLALFLGFNFLRSSAATTVPRALTFVRAHPSLNTLDPAKGSDTSVNSAMSLVLQPLLDYDYTARPYKLIPGAAETLPEISPDAKTYTFRLRETYYLDDPCFGGQRRAVKAQDFIYAFKRLADRKLGGSGEWIVSDIQGVNDFAQASTGEEPTDYNRDIAGLKALDDRTLQITLNHPSNHFIWFFTMCYTAPVPPEAVAYYGQEGLAEHPVGAGAYKLREWRRGYAMTFDRNPEWFGWTGVDFNAEAVPIETVQYRIVKDASTQWLMLLAGELDFLEQIDRDNMDIAIDPDMGASPELRSRGIALYPSPSLKVYYVGINMEDPVLGANKKLRQAINCAFNSEAWEAYYRGRVKALKTVAPPHIEHALQSPFPYAYNLEKARALIREAGYPDGIDPKTGKPLVLTLDVGNSTQSTTESMRVLASFLDAIGIQLQVNVNTWNAHLERIKKRQSQMFLMGWVGDYPDIETFMQLFISKNQSPGPNRTNYLNPELDALYARAISSRDPAEVAACWAQVQAIIREDCPWLFLYYALDFPLVSERITNFTPHNFPYGMEKFLRVKRPSK